ncbi:class I SAM-dependent methyltransferase [endosymbiont 'TC1' of Trimyema compressum]|uniref:class I SAM-dependent methyltransferase n=1 Tax=endosymbiont 'TC1' of Trimyema compressum TaxID=243899 RepID=UPI00248004A1|nr:class I SAM-dependent methyltransferase [endosymbiont 'TC1' of Trimyema compressum]
MFFLKTGGLIGIMVYNGYEGGSEEEEAVKNFLKTLSQKEYNVVVLNHLNRPEDPPYPIVIEKIKDE